jgi:hypothetical protein
VGVLCTRCVGNETPTNVVYFLVAVDIHTVVVSTDRSVHPCLCEI